MARKSRERVNEIFNPLILDYSQRVFRVQIARIQKKRLVVLSAFMLAVLSFVLYSFFAVADIFSFYPTSCLGTWEKPENAQSKPELDTKAVPQDFNETNSAVFNGGAKQIFCGGFKSDEKNAEKILKKAVLKFSWAMNDIPTVTPVLKQSEFEEKLLEFGQSTEIIVVPDPTHVPLASPSLSPEPSAILEPTRIPTAAPTTINPEPTPLPAEPPMSEFSELATVSFPPDLTISPQTTPTPILTPNLIASTSLEPTGSPQMIQTPTPEPVELPATSSFNFFSGLILTVVNEVASASEPSSTGSSSNHDSWLFLETLFERVIEIKNSPSMAVEPGLADLISASLSQEIIPETGFASPSGPELIPANANPEIPASISQENVDIASDSADLPSAANGEENLATNSLENFFEILFSTDGQNWNLVANINQHNFYNLEVPLPISSWGELETLQVMINVLPSDHNLPQVFLDSVWIETQYEDIPQGMELERHESIKEEVRKLSKIKVDASEIIKQPEGKSDFRADEEPVFEINTNFSPAAFPSGSPSPTPSILLPLSPTGKIKVPIVLTWLGKLLKPRSASAQLADQIFAEVFDQKGEGVDIQPVIENMNGKTIVRLSTNRALRPGRFKLQIIIIKNNQAYLASQNFTWGVLAINTSKSIYSPNETASLAMTVLDETGTVVCDAEVTMEITNPATGRAERFSTTGGGMIINPECRQKKVTIKPDYEMQYQTSSPGLYSMKLTAITHSGTWTINDRFEVRETIAFDVQRISATRIFPSRSYLVRLIVKANQDYSGQIVDYIPVSFDIENVSSGGRVSDGEGEKMIIWETELKKGEIYEFSYNYLVPDISPQFYLLGPLDLGAFSEIRKWQIMADEPGPKIPPKTPLVNRCRVEPFPITISGQELTLAKIVLFGEKDIKEGEIGFGDLPSGIDIRFSKNGSNLYQISGNESVLDLEIINQENSQKGNFSIVVIYSKTTNNSLIICQINLINN